MARNRQNETTASQRQSPHPFSNFYSITSAATRINSVRPPTILSTTVNRSAFWRDYVRRFGAITFGVLARFRSAFWRSTVICSMSTDGVNGAVVETPPAVRRTCENCCPRSRCVIFIISFIKSFPIETTDDGYSYAKAEDKFGKENVRGEPLAHRKHKSMFCLSRQEIRHDDLGIADAYLNVRHRQYLRVRKDRITLRKSTANGIKGTTRPHIEITGTIHNKTIQIMTMPLIDGQIDSIVQFGESTLQHPLFGDVHQIHAPP